MLNVSLIPEHTYKTHCLQVNSIKNRWVSFIYNDWKNYHLAANHGCALLFCDYEPLSRMHHVCAYCYYDPLSRMQERRLTPKLIPSWDPFLALSQYFTWHALFLITVAKSPGTKPTASSRVGSLDNAKHSPGGGNVWTQFLLEVPFSSATNQPLPGSSSTG